MLTEHAAFSRVDLEIRILHIYAPQDRVLYINIDEFMESVELKSELYATLKT